MCIRDRDISIYELLPAEHFFLQPCSCNNTALSRVKSTTKMCIRDRHHCLEKLPEEQRTSITRCFLEEMSYADIVEQTGFTLNNVKSYIQNGKRNLKICIKKQTL